jgi:acyl-coenzyme A synthetase/AMP-(fatty) acid ligase
VINVAGHRLGTKELESASITVEEIAEAAAVPVMDELRGRAVEMYVSLKPGMTVTVQGWRARVEPNLAAAREVTFADGSKLTSGPPAGTGGQ